MFRLALYTTADTHIQWAYLYDADPQGTGAATVTLPTVTGYTPYFATVAANTATIPNTANVTVNGTKVNVATFLNNFSRYTCTGNDTLSEDTTNTVVNRRLSTLDDTIPLTLVRANTVANLGKL